MMPMMPHAPKSPKSRSSPTDCGPAPIIEGKFEVTVGAAWTTFAARGEIQLEDYLGVIHACFPKLVHKDIIWDLSAASISEMSRADFEAMIYAVKGYEGVRGYAKTVFVGHTPETFALVCMYTGLAALAELNVDYTAFNKLEHAEQWLVCNGAHGCSRPGAGIALHNCEGVACLKVRLFQAARKTDPIVPVAPRAT